jgi:hypothetical protein
MNAATNIISSGILVAVIYTVLDRRRELGPKLAYGFAVGAAMGATDSYMSTVYPETK